MELAPNLAKCKGRDLRLNRYEEIMKKIEIMLFLIPFTLDGS